jgi:hypothetical protein
VTEATVAAEVHEALDVHGDFATEVALDHVVGVDRFADLEDFGVRQLVHAASGFDAELAGDFLGFGRANAVDVRKRDFYALRRRKVHTCDTGQTASPERPPHPCAGWALNLLEMPAQRQ